MSQTSPSELPPSGPSERTRASTSRERFLEARIEDLERRLTAREKTIRVLSDRMEGQFSRATTDLSLLRENAGLERRVRARTQDLQDALATLQRTQAELLQAQKLSAIGELAAGVAHEINTPIQYVSDNVAFLERAFRVVRGLVEELAPLVEAAASSHAAAAPAPSETAPGGDEDLATRCATVTRVLKRSKLAHYDKQVPKAFEQTLDGLRRVATIVQAMKQLSHPGSGAKEFTELAEVFDTASTVSRHEWKYVAELTIDVAPDVGAVPCHRDQLHQVLLNLIVNAAHAIGERRQLEADASDEGGAAALGHIWLRARREGAWVEVRVEDDGIGIPETIRERIFEPFFTTKPVGRGTGQGLALAWAVVVERHGGTLTVESERGRGSTFVIRLPDAPTTLPPPDPRRAHHESEPR